MKQVRYILSVVVSTIIIGLIFFYLFKYFNRYTSLRAQKQLTQQLDQDIQALQALGFAPNSDLLMVLRKHKAQMFQSADKGQEFCIDRVRELQKRLLMSYVAEAKSLKRQGVDLKSSDMRFAYDTIIRLTIGVSELERQAKLSQSDPEEFQKRMDRMKEITRQSIVHYKRKLADLVRKHKDQDTIALHARELLSTRMKQYYQLS